MTQTNKYVLHKLAQGKPLQGEIPTSTTYSALKKLQKEGYVTYSTKYEIEDPFFREWIRANM